MLSDFSYTLISKRGEGGDFTSICNEIMDFQTHRYEVCLQDMLFLPGTWKNVREGGNTFLIMPANVYYDKNNLRWEQEEPGVIRESFKHPSKHYQIECKIPPGFYSNPHELIKNVNDAIKVIENDDANVLKLNGQFKYDPTKVTHMGGTFENEKRQVYKVTGILQWSATDTDKLARIQLCKELAYLLGITPTLTSYLPALKHGWKGDLADVDLSRNNLTMIWIFADFIGTTMVANKRLPLLRLVPIQAGSGLFEHSIFTMQHYVPVRAAKIQNFRIFIRDRITDCNTMNLEMEDRLIVTLHFRLRE